MKVKDAVKKFASMFGFYAGAVPSHRRMELPFSYSDFHFDTSTMDFQQLRSTSRWIAANCPIYNEILNIRQLLIVGSSGLQVMPNSGDKAFDALAKDAWKKFCDEGDLGSDLSFDHAQAIACSEMDRDGDCFAILATSGGEPKIQWVESHRVRGTGEVKSGNRLEEGIELNKYGKPVAYFIADEYGSKQELKRVAASNVVHFYDPERFGQRRGLPICTPGINDFIDYIMLQMFLMDREKFNSTRLTMITLPGGEKLNLTELRARSLQSNNGSSWVNQKLTDITEKQRKSIKEYLGGAAETFPNGTEFKDIKSDTPSPNTMAFLDSVINKCFLACDLTRQTILPLSMQGTAERVVLEVNNKAMLSRSAVIANGIKRIYKHAVSKIRGKTMSDRWCECVVSMPAIISADLGYEAKIIESGLRNGLYTKEEILSRRGIDPQEHEKKILAEYDAAKQAAEERKTSITEIASRGLAALSGNIGNKERQEEKEPVKKKEKEDEESILRN